jgi:hypothetical protein
MLLKRILGTVTAIGAITVAVVLYTVHPVKSSDHQDTYNLATRSNTSADITDVYVFPSPANSANVVFAMDVSPLITPSAVGSKFFDPTLLYQFKIAHGATNFTEDQVIQIVPTGTGANQELTLYIGAPAQVGTTNTIISKQPIGTASFNVANTGLSSNAVSLFGGPRVDPFFFDLFAFFTFAGDRNYGTHTSQSDPGPETASNPEGLSNGDNAANLAGLVPAYDTTAGGNPGPGAPSFNGFTAGQMSTTDNAKPSNTYAPALGSYACSTNPASDTLFAGPFNVLSIVVEVPKSMISGAPYNTGNIHVWATTSSSTGS